MTETDQARRVVAAHRDDLEDGDLMRVPGPDAIALYRIGDEYFATSDTCTHEDWSLGDEGDLEDGAVVCSLHNARFDVRTGRALCWPATLALRTYPVEIDGDDVVVIIGDGAGN